MTHSSPCRRSRVSPCSCRVLLPSKRPRRASLRPLGSGRLGVESLGRDQAVQPRDVLLGRVATVLDHRQRVRVTRGRRERRRDGVEPLLEERAPALEQPDPRFGSEVLEEGEADAEPVVLRGRVRAGLFEELTEERLAVIRDAVDVLSATDLLLIEDLLDRSLLLEALQRRVQRAVRDAPEPPERVREALRELVAVHGPLLQQSEDRELQHLLGPSLAGVTGSAPG